MLKKKNGIETLGRAGSLASRSPRIWEAEARRLLQTEASLGYRTILGLSGYNFGPASKNQMKAEDPNRTEQQAWAPPPLLRSQRCFPRLICLVSTLLNAQLSLSTLPRHSHSPNPSNKLSSSSHLCVRFYWQFRKGTLWPWLQFTIGHVYLLSWFLKIC